MYIIFSPLFYINGDPHIGHSFTIKIIDIIERLFFCTSNNVIKYTGTDEHGDKVYNKYLQLKQNNNTLTFDEFIECSREKFAKIHSKAYAKYHTHTQYHMAQLRQFFEILQKSNIIYEGQYEGLYCIREERYISDDELSKYDTKDLTKRSEKGLFMKIDNEISEELIKNIQHLIINPHYRKEAQQLLRQTTGDIFISRNMSNDALISIEDYDDLSFYVWFDAINYYNAAIINYSYLLTKNIIVLACDIMRFHLILLLHICYYLYDGYIPFRFFIHGLINMHGKKVSKSFNNFEILDNLYIKHGELFFASIVSNGIEGELNVTEQGIESYTTTIKNNVRNLYNRILSIYKIYSMYYNMCVIMLSLEFNQDSKYLQKLIFQIKEIQSSLDISKLYPLLLQLATYSNQLINQFELWKCDYTKVEYILKLTVYMKYMIIIEYILGHDVNKIIKITNLCIDASLHIVHDQKFIIDNLTASDILI
jgi:methionyl-tRNA synthetase